MDKCYSMWVIVVFCTKDTRLSPPLGSTIFVLRKIRKLGFEHQTHGLKSGSRYQTNYIFKNVLRTKCQPKKKKPVNFTLKPEKLARYNVTEDI